jgi:SNF2 family DNA or RNA helicase
MLLQSLNLDDYKYILDEDADEVDEIDYVDYSTEIVSLIESVPQTSKMTACINQTVKLVSENKTVIIWCIFVDTMHKIRDLLAKQDIHAKVVNGSVELEERGSILQGFKNGDFSVLITNPHTLAESVSLHAVCHDAIYFEYSYNLVHLLQSKDRIHRLGLPDNQYTQYYFLQAVNQWKDEPFSIDNEVYQRLRLKEQTMLEAINNNVLEHVVSSDVDLDIVFEKLYT